MTKRAKYLTLALSAVASWLAMLLVGTLAYIAGPVIGFMVGFVMFVSFLARVVLREDSAK